MRFGTMFIFKALSKHISLFLSSVELTGIITHETNMNFFVLNSQTSMNKIHREFHPTIN
jgi:hypothetical protein